MKKLCSSDNQYRTSTSMHFRHGFAVVLALLGALPCLFASALPDGEDSEDEAIQYKKNAPHDVISKLQMDMDVGKVRLTSQGRQGVLLSLLHQLNIPLSSQILVFAKTSFQRELISPSNPRALYFNDSTYIGWVQGSPVIEVLTMDPRLGATFYTLNQDHVGKLQFARGTDECLQCHETAMSNRVPGNIFRSVYPHPDGQPEFSAGSFLTDDTSPFEERWGGWYVTGTHGAMRHMGNIVARGARENITMDKSAGANVVSLSRFFQTSHYPTPTSDIVALMIAEHQTHVQNLIIRANYQTRIAERYDEALNRDLNRPSDYHSDSMRSRIASVCEPLVKALLFCGEAPLTEPVKGTSGFAEQFQKQGPADTSGRSLRVLDLKSRLFKYRCSYLIYSDLFKGLPQRAREFVYRRIQEITTGADKSSDFAHLSATERSEIQSILLDTCREYSDYCKTHAPSAGK
jgi:hypothetical protein